MLVKQRKIGLLVSLVVFSMCVSSLTSEGRKTHCTFGKLDPESFKDCGNKGYAMQCNGTDLEKIPRSYPKPDNETTFPSPLCALNLSNNNFHFVRNESFVNVTNLNSTDVLGLYLEDCNISYIASNAFENLTRLLYLNLSGNHLHQVDSLGHGVFKPLLSLKNINLNENYFHTFKFIGKELSYMETLKGLYIDLCEECIFGEDFKHLSNLEILGLSGLLKKACNVPVVRNDTFHYVSGIRKLAMASCNIATIEADAFSPLKNLTLLDISYNENLTFAGMNVALFGLRNSSTLQILNVNRLHPLYGLGIKLEMSDIQNLKTLNALEILHMDLNKIEVFDEDIFKTFQLPKSLKEFTLSGNRLTYDTYATYLHRAVGITKIDISRQHLNIDPFYYEHYETQSTNEQDAHAVSLKTEDECPKECDVCLPKTLHYVGWRQSFVYYKIDRPMLICNATNLGHLDLSFNLIMKWKQTISGLENMTHLDLSENYCDEIQPAFLERFFSLRHLNISGNMLGEFLEPVFNPNSSKIFQHQHNLTKLDMSNNEIKYLPKDIFKPLQNIEYLNLSGNFIEDWNCSLNSQNLRDLDLSGNKLYALPESLTAYLDSLLDDDRNNTRDISVHLSENPLECTCTTLPFLKWMWNSKIHVRFHKEYSCRLNSENYRFDIAADISDIIHVLETDNCVDKSWIAWTVGSACCVLAGVLSVVACVLVYKKRWKIRYMYYSRNRRHRHEGFERLFENDAFVSYASNNASFIKNKMVPALEEQHRLQLWVADRNSRAGTSTAENICHGINNSRKCVLLVNRKYLNDDWCDYEMNMAHMESLETNRNMIIVVFMESMPMDHIPTFLLRLLQSVRFIEFPEHDQDMSTFWMNLADEINS